MLYEGIKLNKVNHYDYILTGESKECVHVDDGEEMGGRGGVKHGGVDHEQLMFCTVCGDADLSNRGLNRQKFNTFTMFCCIFPEVPVMLIQNVYLHLFD